MKNLSPTATPESPMHAYFSELGTRGGKSRSARKLSAIAANLAKAQATKAARKPALPATTTVLPQSLT